MLRTTRRYDVDTAFMPPGARRQITRVVLGKGARTRCHSNHGAHDCVSPDPL